MFENICLWIVSLQNYVRLFVLMHQPANEKNVEFWCEGSFQVLREEDDITRSRRAKSLSLGRLPWISPAYFKKTQTSKLVHQQTIRSSLVRLYFHFFTLYVLFLERQCAFVFSLFLFCLLLYTCWILALLFGRDTRSAFSLEYSCSSLIFVEYSYLATAKASNSLFSYISCQSY